jgi:anti-anti-sigma factor
VTALLRGWGIDPEPHLARGQLVIETAMDLYVPGGEFDPDRTADALLAAVVSARAEGYRALRLTAEMGWAVRGLPGSEHLLEFEGRLRGVLAAGSAMAICQYDRNVFHPAALENVTRVHQAPVTVDAEFDDGVLRITRTFQPPGLRIEGEVDATTAGELARALAAAAGRGDGDVHVDLSCLEFIDLGGLRALVAAAAGLEGLRSLVLRGVRPHLRRLIRLVGWEDTPGLVIRGDGA